MPPATLSLIMPVLDDEAALRERLPELAALAPEMDLIVVDGGSRDASAAVAAGAGLRLLHSHAPGRARQMNFGAAAATGDILLFLHADTLLPAAAPAAIRNAIADGCVGGAFARRFDSPSRLLRLTCRLADARGRLFGWFLGDQAIFALRKVFLDTGGYPDWPWFEDLEFSRRLARAGRTRLLTPPVVTSARRFHRRGPLRQSLRDFRLTLQFLARGKPPPHPGE
ncbi:MAG: glycosyltransferase [Puniceicoccaceae bacterium]|nr:MAG: glycosyltransferase [Puniceicoccaceae bacterium]